ncbi:FG-GAP repeat domain-containing protein [Rhodopirellula halodulae]|uniref:FG-GAP repeat domain-containing protein n=1 Tax=Rhodopirellula halodulae TaxID=2894198 RepID=UPI001E57796E|nr:VCBS repeat-containing protein [Rhodopirellula sp. JC737]MCC9658117.1 VCBS repeat-containing protein [Rhodopirellula sp. JC737]
MRSRLVISRWVCVLCLSAIVAGASAEDELSFDVRLLTLDANEGIAAGDVDGDGKKDLVAGRNWFRNGDWAPRPLRAVDDWNGYVQSNGDYLWDVDADGRLDVIAGSFLPTEVNWYRNPGDEALRLGKMWPESTLVDTGASANEGQLFEDIDGDGRPEWIVNSWKNEVPTVIWRLEPKKAEKEGAPAYALVRHELGDQFNGHGIGVGDLNGDGKKDILVGWGWYEQPAEDPWSQPWIAHQDWKLHASLPVIIEDIDGDGDADVIFGHGHNYGLEWWENTGVDSEGNLEWEAHEIDKRFSQPHSMVWTDLDGDGNKDLVTGKRYFAHNGNDPGGKEVPCLYWYSFDPASKSFDRHTIDEGRVGTGLQIVVEDLNDDGHKDIAVAGKSGTYLLLAKP